MMQGLSSDERISWKTRSLLPLCELTCIAVEIPTSISTHFNRSPQRRAKLAEIQRITASSWELLRAAGFPWRKRLNAFWSSGIRWSRTIHCGILSKENHLDSFMLDRNIRFDIAKQRQNAHQLPFEDVKEDLSAKDPCLTSKRQSLRHRLSIWKTRQLT